MALKVITPPATDPISLAEATLFARIDTSDDSTVVADIIAAAHEYCAAYQNRSYITQTLEVTLDGWPDFPISLPRPPLVTVTSIKYYDTANTEYTWAPSNYFVDTDSEPGRIALAYGVTTPNTILRDISAVKIRYTAGGAIAPKRVKQAMLMLISYWYNNRDAAAAGQVSREVAFALRSLLGQERVVPV